MATSMQLEGFYEELEHKAGYYKGNIPAQDLRPVVKRILDAGDYGLSVRQGMRIARDRGFSPAVAVLGQHNQLASEHDHVTAIQSNIQKGLAAYRESLKALCALPVDQSSDFRTHAALAMTVYSLATGLFQQIEQAHDFQMYPNGIKL